MANKTTQKATTVVDIKTAFANARKLQEKEQLPLVDKLYACNVDESTGVVTFTITANLSDVVRSSKGSNFVLPLANVKGVRGTGVIQAVSENGLVCKLYADRVYLSTPEIEKEKEDKAKSKNDSEKELLKKQNAMLMALLAEKGISL